MINMEHYLTVKIFTVDRQLPEIKCDSVRLPVSDSSKGEFSGSYGIKKGHAKAVFSLRKGKVVASSEGEQIFSTGISDGFAMVENNEVRITVDTVDI